MTGWILGLLIGFVLIYTSFCAYYAYNARNHIHPVKLFILMFISPVSLPLSDLYQWWKGRKYVDRR